MNESSCLLNKTGDLSNLDDTKVSVVSLNRNSSLCIRSSNKTGFLQQNMKRDK